MPERELTSLEGFNIISCFPYAIILELEAETETCASTAKASPLIKSGPSA